MQDMMDVDLDMALKVHEFLDIKGAITEHYQKEEERRQNLKNSTGR